MAPDHDARLVSLADLTPYGRNPRRGDVGAIRESLQANGQYRPLVVRSSSNEVLAGNHTLEALRQEGWSEVWATFVDVDDDQAARIVLVDNRSNDLAGYDDEALLELIGELPTLEGTGYDEDAVRALVASVVADGAPPPDSAPPAPAEPEAKPGDLYRLGAHRLLCGDATSADAIVGLMDGEPAHAVWTDPPYGVDYVGKTAEALEIQNDGAEGLDALLADAFAMVDTALRPGAAIYVAHPAGRLSVTFGTRFLGQGWRLHQTLVWAKDTMVLGHSDYHYKHEPILFGYKAGGGRRGRGGKGWYGDNSQVSVFEVAKPPSSREHPTMKPIELIERCLGNSTVRGDAVLDPFGGSGSTLMACEHMGRCARLLELDPRYCEVIVRRWEDHTGLEAERVEA